MNPDAVWDSQSPGMSVINKRGRELRGARQTPVPYRNTVAVARICGSAFPISFVDSARTDPLLMSAFNEGCRYDYSAPLAALGVARLIAAAAAVYVVSTGTSSNVAPSRLS
jgi:hypothetical protein